MVFYLSQRRLKRKKIVRILKDILHFLPAVVLCLSSSTIYIKAGILYPAIVEHVQHTATP